MKKIGFHLYNRSILKVDFRRPLDGNPGVGGSEYLIVLTAWQLSIRDNGLNITLFPEQDGLFPEGLPVHIVDGDIDRTLEISSQEDYDILVVDHKRLKWNEHPFQAARGRMKVVCWCHNFVSPNIAKIMVQSPCLERVIAVGREQMDLFRDDRLFTKSDYIYNSVPIKDEYIESARLIPYKDRPHAVAYLGSLVKEKSFHVLASIWTSILKEVPDAELYVIGSGNVYSQNAKLGKYGVAEEQYENIFMPYLTDKNGNIIPSVHFLGAMGKEKYEVLQRVRVGCPNPTGLSETFCLSAVEMQMMGCCVVAMDSPGYYDTFYNGVISHSVEDLTKDIVRILKGSPIKDYDETLNYIQQNFSVGTVIADWEKLLLGSTNYLHPILPLSHPFFRCKWLKEISRLIRNVFPPLYEIPNTDRLISLMQRILNQ